MIPFVIIQASKASKLFSKYYLCKQLNIINLYFWSQLAFVIYIRYINKIQFGLKKISVFEFSKK
jgi:hypothetical protein